MRFAASLDGFYKRKGKLVARKRSERSDKGCKRKGYRFLKRVRRLSEASALIGLVKGEASLTAKPASELPEMDIMAAHSPLKRKSDG